MKSRILNVRNVPFQRWAHGERFDFKVAWAGLKLGSKKLGFNVTVIPPGKRGWPFHAHHANEEMFYVLEGRGSIRIGKSLHRIRAGDFISLPPGRRWAHQILNDSKAPLRYLAVSTMEAPDVAEYPDSGKVGIFAGTPPGRPVPRSAMRHFARVRDGVGYWDDER